ncbi:unnamed protein product [Porites lobata]|uniref:ABC transmembrane type-1 domain-containing protein n=1 Tax=Porites lobata TaxID=104759 RepID=A0ABN8S832_9CNID|nr:unnamed protein product [Porites lobata]
MTRDGYKKVPDEDHTEKISCLSFMFFHWMNNVLKTGNERPIEQSDFLPLSEENTSSFLIEHLQKEWNKEKAKCKGKKKRPKLWKSVLKLLPLKEVLILTVNYALYSLSRLLQPLLLGFFMVSLMSPELHSVYLLYGCALGMGINALIGSLAMHHFDYRGEVWGLRFSSALKGLIYLKTLVLTKSALLKFSTGHVIDLLSNDVQRLEEEAFKLLFSIVLHYSRSP